MKLTKELQRIYDSEINFSITTFWDGGFDVKLGDEMNGFVAKSNHDTIKSAILWLIENVMDFYPTSLYAYSRLSIINKIRSGHVNTDRFTPGFLDDMIDNYERKHPSIYRDLETEYRGLMSAN